MRRIVFVGILLGFLAAHVALAGSPTAFELVKRGDRYVGAQSKGKVLRIYSEKSVAVLTPDIWHVVYYDPDASLKEADVKFGAGQEMGVSRGWRPFQFPAKASDVLPTAKLKVDSDRALKIATEQPLLKNLTLKASKLVLNHSDFGPVWKVQLWAAKLQNPEKQVDIGTVVLSATDGSVVKSDLHPSKVE